MEQSVIDEEHVFARLVAFTDLCEQLGPIQQYHKLYRAESKTDICLLSKVSVGTKCLNLEIITRELVIFEEINNICCFQVRVESMRTPRYDSPSPLEELRNFYHQRVLWLRRSSCVSDKAGRLQNWTFLC